jgi:hypothetical protein
VTLCRYISSRISFLNEFRAGNTAVNYINAIHTHCLCSTNCTTACQITGSSLSKPILPALSIYSMLPVLTTQSLSLTQQLQLLPQPPQIKPANLNQTTKPYSPSPTLCPSIPMPTHALFANCHTLLSIRPLPSAPMAISSVRHAFKIGSRLINHLQRASHSHRAPANHCPRSAPRGGSSIEFVMFNIEIGNRVNIWDHR